MMKSVPTTPNACATAMGAEERPVGGSDKPVGEGPRRVWRGARAAELREGGRHLLEVHVGVVPLQDALEAAQP
jgi:hypothetical protein